MEKKKLTVRDLVKKLLEFNMDAKIEININGVPFYLNSDFSLCWSIYDGDSYKALGDISSILEYYSRL